jgi:hypothetical protein
LYNDQRNAEVFLCIFQFTSALRVSGFLSAHLQKQVYNFGVVQVSGYGVSRALTPYPSRSCVSASEDGLKESRKHVWQK